MGRKAGGRGMFLGAVAQSLPDIDFIAAFWKEPADNLLAHRGFTHSVLFVLLASMAAALLVDHFQKKKGPALVSWFLFFAAEMCIHLLVDLFNNYGVGIWEPFSHARISFNALFVVDPFFSIWPALAFAGLLSLKRHHPRRKFWWKFGVILPSVYLLYCTYNKQAVDQSVRRSLSFQGIRFDRYMTTPTPLNNWLWYAVAMGKDSAYVGFHSVFDRKPARFVSFPLHQDYLDTLRDHEEVQQLIRFSQSFYTVERWHDTLVFNDLRFGQEVGWYDRNGHFAFHYFIGHPPASNHLVVQRGRFAGWNAATMKSMIKRISGN